MKYCLQVLVIVFLMGNYRAQSPGSNTQGEAETEMIIKIIALADSLLEQDSLDKSLKYYKRVVRLAPANTYAQNQIDFIKELTSKGAKPSNRIILTSKEEILKNANDAQEQRIEKTMNFQPKLYIQRER